MLCTLGGHSQRPRDELERIRRRFGDRAGDPEGGFMGSGFRSVHVMIPSPSPPLATDLGLGVRPPFCAPIFSRT
jgi:hypothetical protein